MELGGGEEGEKEGRGGGGGEEGGGEVWVGRGEITEGGTDRYTCDSTRHSHCCKASIQHLMLPHRRRGRIRVGTRMK